MSDVSHAFADQLHAVADQHRARDVALAHSHDERAATLRDTIASLIAADETSMVERNKRFEDQIAYMTALRDAENASALAQRQAAIAVLVDEIDFHTRVSDQVTKGEPIMPVAAQIRSEPVPEPQPKFEPSGMPVDPPDPVEADPLQRAA